MEKHLSNSSSSSGVEAMTPWRGGRLVPCEVPDAGYNPGVFHAVEEISEAIKYDDLDSSESDSNGDGEEGSNESKPKPKKRVPKCARCKNHGIIAKVKDHKDDCPSRFCLCDKCIAIASRQRDMKKQTALRRRLVRYKKLKEKNERKRKKLIRLKSLPLAPKFADNGKVVPAVLPPPPPPLPSLAAGNKLCSDSVKSTCRPGGVKPSNVPTVPNALSIANVPPMVSVPNAQSSPPLVLNLSAPKLDNLKSDMDDCKLTETKQPELLLEYCSRVMKRFGFSLESLPLIYVILDYTKKNVELAQKRIMEANNEIQESTLYRTLKAGIFPYCFPGNVATVDNFNKPTYLERAPYVAPADMDLLDGTPKRPSSDPGIVSPSGIAGLNFFPYPTNAANPLQKSSSYPEMASLPTTAGLGIFPYHMETYVTAAKVPTSPSSPHERPSSYPGMESQPAVTSLAGFLPYTLGLAGAPVTAAAKMPANPVSPLEELPSYPGMPFPPTTAGLGLFTYPLGSYVKAAKVPISPASPRERHSSYPRMASPPTAASISFLPYALNTTAAAEKVSSSPASSRDKSATYADSNMSHQFKVETNENTD